MIRAISALVLCIAVWLIGVPLLTQDVSVLTSLGLWLRESGAVLLRLRQML